MKVLKVLDTKVGMVSAGIVGVIILLYLGEKKIRDGAAAVGEAINPVSDQNLVYRGVNGVGSALTGNDNFDLGVWTYDLIHGSAEQQAERAKEQSYFDSLGG